MEFTTQCFIRKNTANIRNRLKELGYYCNPYLGWNNLFTCVFGVNSVYSLDDYDTNGLKEIDGLIDCGTNEELFLAIAALRDDSNYMQWFIAESSLSVSFGDAIGNDHYFIEPKGSFFFWGIEYQNATIISGNFRKATVNELIEHFKTKEEQ